MRTQVIKRNRRQTTLVIGMLVLLAIFLWSINGIKVYAQDKAQNDKVEYQLQEKQFLNKVRTTLETNGYENSGITLTKIMDTNGNREYTVLIHNADIDLDSQEEVSVYNSLNGICMEWENATVFYEIF